MTTAAGLFRREIGERVLLGAVDPRVIARE